MSGGPKATASGLRKTNGRVGSMAPQKKPCKAPGWRAAIGISGIIAGLAMMTLLMSAPVQGYATQPDSTFSTAAPDSIPPMSAQLPFQPQFQAVSSQPDETKPTQIAALLAQAGQQPVNVNGRLVYAVPAVVGPDATAILQNIAPGGIAYVVHPLAGWGKSVSTTVSWFRCADIVSPNQYNGSQVEIENWTLLTQQERMEAQAACSLPTFAA
jgi:hypothetical protein